MNLKVYMRIFLAYFFFIGASSDSKAQCTINSSLTVPGVYPDTLPPATAGILYSQDVTMVFLLDTLGLSITNYKIVNITGLPAGITWQCNSPTNGCSYNPAVTPRACIGINGTPQVPGIYIINVQIKITVQLLGVQTYSVDGFFHVLPATSSNPGFTIANAQGCAPLTASFTNNQAGATSYYWDFGNGDTSTLANPPDQTYNTGGTYIVAQSVVYDTLPYYLTNVTITAASCNDWPFGAPDFFCILKNQSGAVVHSTYPGLSNVNPPASVSFPAVQLQNQNYLLEVWDNDNGLLGANDFCGSVSFNGHQSGVFSLTNGQGFSVDIAINHPVQNIISTDTIIVFQPPATPLVTTSGSLTFCFGDSSVLTSSAPSGNAWHLSGQYIIGADYQDFVAKNDGSYSVVVTGSNGCTAESAPISVVALPVPAKPTFWITGNALNTAIAGNIQWMLNGSAIPFAIGPTHIVTVAGTYSLIITDPNGCFTESDAVFITPVGVHLLQSMSQRPVLFPNPANDMATLGVSMLQKSVIELFLLRADGTIVWTKKVWLDGGDHQINIDLQEYDSGLYLMQVRDGSYLWNQKLVKVIR